MVTDSNGKDLLSLQTRSVGLTRDAMLNGQSDGGGCDIMGVRKKNLLNGNCHLFKDSCQAISHIILFSTSCGYSKSAL